MSLPMFDISGNNHPDNQPINWKKVAKAGYKGVIIKATEGLDYINPWLHNDSAGATANKLAVGYYHFAHPGQSDAADQAKFAVNQIQHLPHALGLSLDLEVQEGKTWAELAEWAKNFISYVAGLNITSPIYLNLNFLDNLPGAPFGHKLWLAEPSHTPRMSTWMWQKSWTGSVPGVVGDVDLDAYNG